MATNLEFIKKVEVTNGANPEITDIFSDKYDVYKIFITKVDLGTGFVNAFGNMRLINASTGTPDTTANYDSAGLYMYSHTGFGENRYTNQTRIVNTFSYMNTGAENNWGEVTIFNPYNSGSYTFFTGQSSSMFYQIGSGSFVTPTKSIAVHTVEQSNSGLQILISDITTMDIAVFGVK
jgi:hypothetical protein